MNINRILLLPIVAISLMIGQDDPVVGNFSYLKIKPGKAASFEKAVASHVKRYHGADQWRTWGGKVVSGKRSGQYLVGSGGHYWKDYAERKTTKAHDDQWEAIINNHVESTSGSVYYVKDLEASYNDRSAPMWQTQIFYTNPGKRGDMTSLLRKSAKVRAETNSDESRGVFYNVTGGEQNGIVYIATRMDDLGDMVGPSKGLDERWIKVHGQKDWDKVLPTWWTLFHKSETEIVKVIPGMNSPQE